jgi:hypothetical protein
MGARCPWLRHAACSLLRAVPPRSAPRCASEPCCAALAGKAHSLHARPHVTASAAPPARQARCRATLVFCARGTPAVWRTLSTGHSIAAAVKPRDGAHAAGSVRRCWEGEGGCACCERASRHLTALGALSSPQVVVWTSPSFNAPPSTGVFARRKTARRGRPLAAGGDTVHEQALGGKFAAPTLRLLQDVPQRLAAHGLRNDERGSTRCVRGSVQQTGVHKQPPHGWQ